MNAATATPAPCRSAWPISAITSQYRTDYGMLFAGLVLVTIPILVVYVALQKHLVKGITAAR